MDRDVLSAFVSLFPGRPSSKGWRNIDCPMCGDSRKRLGIVESPSGGFRIRCFNGGCPLNEASGWEPGSGLGGKPKLLFTMLGGDIRDLPLAALMSQSNSYDSRGNVVVTPRTHFKEMQLPPGCIDIFDTDDACEEQIAALDYLIERGEELASSHKFMWTPEHPEFVIVPYYHFGTVVGYGGRSVTGDKRFIGSCPHDYIFNQDKIRYTDRSVIVVEGLMDGIAIDAAATRNSSMTKNQIAVLNDCGSIPIVLPDQQAEGLSYVETARKNGWFVSIPEWDGGVKDATAAVKRYGRLFTVETVVKSASRDYDKAALSLMLKGVKI